jgi:hypothetical protein
MFPDLDVVEPFTLAAVEKIADDQGEDKVTGQSWCASVVANCNLPTWPSASNIAQGEPT